MLGDKTIARTLRRSKPAFYDYIFEEARPTFIHVHDTWTYWARLDDDPRFRRDYTPVFEYPDPWIGRRHGLTQYSGDYVRRDALNEANAAAFARLRTGRQRRAGFSTAIYHQVTGDSAAAGARVRRCAGWRYNAGSETGYSRLVELPGDLSW